MDDQHKKFMAMVSNIRIDHTVICQLLDDIAISTYQNAIKQLVVLRQLLINHLFVEDFILHPYIRNRYINKREANSANLFDLYEIDDGRDDMVALTQRIGHYDSIGEKVIEMLSSCSNAKPDEFSTHFTALFDFVKTRIEFEDTVLEKRIATRINIRVRVALVITGEIRYTGTSINISESGCLFKVGASVPHATEGATGTFRILSFANNNSFLCQIVRIQGDLIAVQFLQLLSESIMQQLYPYKIS